MVWRNEEREEPMFGCTAFMGITVESLFALGDITFSSEKMSSVTFLLPIFLFTTDFPLTIRPLMLTLLPSGESCKMKHVIYIDDK